MWRALWCMVEKTGGLPRDSSRELFEVRDGRLVTCRVTEQDRAAGLDRAAEIPLGGRSLQGFCFYLQGLRTYVSIYIPAIHQPYIHVRYGYVSVYLSERRPEHSLSRPFLTYSPLFLSAALIP